MTAGILQLVTRGYDDIFLTEDPQITLFKTIYRRHTNFSKTEYDLQFINKLDFGKTGIVTIERLADLVHRLFLVIKLPKIDICYDKITPKVALEYGIKWDGFSIEDLEKLIITEENKLAMETDKYKQILKSVCNQKVIDPVDFINTLIDNLIKYDSGYDSYKIIQKEYGTSNNKVLKYSDIVEMVKNEFKDFVTSNNAEILELWNIEKTLDGQQIKDYRDKYDILEDIVESKGESIFCFYKSTNDWINLTKLKSILPETTFQKYMSKYPELTKDFYDNLDNLFNGVDDSFMEQFQLVNHKNIYYVNQIMSIILDELAENTDKTEEINRLRKSIISKEEQTIINKLETIGTKLYLATFNRQTGANLEIFIKKINDIFGIDYTDDMRVKEILRLNAKFSEIYDNFYDTVGTGGGTTMDEDIKDRKAMLQFYDTYKMALLDIDICKEQKNYEDTVCYIVDNFVASKKVSENIKKVLLQQKNYTIYDIFEKFKKKPEWNYIKNMDYDDCDYENDIYDKIKDMIIKKSIFYKLNDLKKDNIKDTVCAIKEYFNILKNRVNKYDDLKEIIARIGKKPKFAWIRNIGHYIIKCIRVKMNDQLIDNRYGEWMFIWHSLTKRLQKERGYNLLIGNIPELYSFNTELKDEYEMIIPLPLWFCDDIGAALPLVAMKGIDTKMYIDLRSLEEVSRFEKGITFRKDPKLECSVIGEYVYVDNLEREKIASSTLEYLIESVRFSGDLEFVDNCNNGLIVANYDFPGLSREMFWVLQRKEFIDGSLGEKKYDNYGIDYKTGEESIIKRVQIKFNERIREHFKDDIFYNSIQPYKHHSASPPNGVYCYSFALHPENSRQPSGILNTGLLEYFVLEIELSDAIIELLKNKKTRLRLATYALSNSVLRISNGIAGVLFY